MLPGVPAHVEVSRTALTLLSTWGGVPGVGQRQVVRQGPWAGSELGLWAGSVLGPWAGAEPGPWAGADLDPWVGSVLGAPVLRGSTGVIHFKGLALKAGFPLTAVWRE